MDDRATAKLISSRLGEVDDKTKERIALSIEKFLCRQREKFEVRRSELLNATQARLPWEKLKNNVIETMYPVMLEPYPRMDFDHHAVLDVLDANRWKPIPVGSTRRATLDEQRESWIEQNTSRATSDHRPTTCNLDVEGCIDVFDHSLMGILKSCLDNPSSTKTKLSGKDAQIVERRPDEMEPNELVQLMSRDPAAFDRHSMRNTVISYGATTPTEEDRQRANMNKMRPTTNVVSFDPELDVAKVPVGSDFDKDERVDRTVENLKKGQSKAGK